MPRQVVSAGYGRRLLESRSIVAAAEHLTAELTKLRLERVVVTHSSADRRALVVVAAAGVGNVATGERIPTTVCSDSGSGDDVRLTAIHRKGAEAAGIVPWWKHLKASSSATWLEINLALHDGARLVIFADTGNGRRGKLVDKAGEVVVDELVKTYARYAALHLQQADARALVSAEQRLLGLDRIIATVLGDWPVEVEPAVPDLLDVISEAVVEVTGADYCEIALEQAGVFEPVSHSGSLAQCGLSLARADDRAAHSITLKAIRAGKPSVFVGPRKDPVVDEMRTHLDDPKHLERFDHLRSWGAFPIRLRGNYVGAISVASRDWDFFLPWCRRTMELFAEKAAFLLAVQSLLQRRAQAYARQKDRIDSLQDQFRSAATRAGFQEAARTVIHNLANLIQPMGKDLDDIRSNVPDRAKKRFHAALESLEAHIEGIESVFDNYRRLKGDETDVHVQDLNELLDLALELCMARAQQSRINIDVSRDIDVAPVACNESEMVQALVNLLVNAMDAILDNPETRRRIRIRVLDTTPTVTMKIEDSGVGIANRDLARIWEWDFTTKQHRNGTGLGLPHVKQVVESARGKVDLTSKQKKGTTVTISLPRASAS